MGKRKEEKGEGGRGGGFSAKEEDEGGGEGLATRRWACGGRGLRVERVWGLGCGAGGWEVGCGGWGWGLGVCG